MALLAPPDFTDEWLERWGRPQQPITSPQSWPAMAAYAAHSLDPNRPASVAEFNTIMRNFARIFDPGHVTHLRRLDIDDEVRLAAGAALRRGMSLARALRDAVASEPSLVDGPFLAALETALRPSSELSKAEFSAEGAAALRPARAGQLDDGTGPTDEDREQFVQDIAHGRAPRVPELNPDDTARMKAFRGAVTESFRAAIALAHTSDGLRRVASALAAYVPGIPRVVAAHCVNSVYWSVGARRVKHWIPPSNSAISWDDASRVPVKVARILTLVPDAVTHIRALLDGRPILDPALRPVLDDDLPREWLGAVAAAALVMAPTMESVAGVMRALRLTLAPDDQPNPAIPRQQAIVACDWAQRAIQFRSTLDCTLGLFDTRVGESTVGGELVRAASAYGGVVRIPPPENAETNAVLPQVAFTRSPGPTDKDVFAAAERFFTTPPSGRPAPTPGGLGD